MNNIESYLDNLFTNAAAKTESFYKDKIIEYTLFDDNCHIVRTGKGRIRTCRYDKSIDCNIYVLDDIDREILFAAHQFEIDIRIPTE